MLHDATYTQLKVQHNLQPRSLRISCFCVSVVPFSVLVFSDTFFSGNLFLKSVSKIFFLMAAYFGGKRVCVYMCVCG